MIRISTKRLVISAIITGFFSFAAAAGALVGTVKGANGASKFLVKVVVAGQVTHTNKNGEFYFSNLPNGTQSVQITEQARRQTFEVTISNSPLERTFKVNW